MKLTFWRNCNDYDKLLTGLTNRNPASRSSELDSNRCYYDYKSLLRNHFKIINLTYRNKTYPYFYTENQVRLIV